MKETKILFESAAVYGYALSYNRLPLIERLLIENGEEELCGLELTLTATPAFFEKKTFSVERLLPNGRYVISAPPLVFDADHLAYLQETVPAVLCAVLTKDGEILTESKQPLSLLPANAFTSSELYPELIASLISPDQPEIQKVADAVSTVLSPRGIFRRRHYAGHTSKAVLTMMECLYHTLRSLRLSYAMQTPDCTKKGTTLKFPEQVIKTRKGNSLEIALLYASLLEAMGMHPVIAFFKQQTFVGCHMRETSFPAAAFDTYDTLFTRDMTDGNKDAVYFLEMGTLAYGTAVAFDEALKSAKAMMKENKADFVLAVDVYRARESGVASLPNRLTEGEHCLFAHIEAGTEKMPGYDDLAARQTGDVFDRTAAKLRTRITRLDDEILLAPQSGGNGVQLLDCDPAEIIAKLSRTDGALLAATPFRFSAQDRTVDDLCLIAEKLSSTLADSAEQDAFYTFLPEDTLDPTLSSLFARAASRAESRGCSGLCIGIGLIKYKEEYSYDTCFAPAILYPVRLISGDKGGYRIASDGQAPVYHEALFEKLDRIFGILPDGLPALAGRGFASQIPTALRQIESAYSLCSGVSLCKGSCLGIFAHDEANLLSLIRPSLLRAHPLTSALISKKYTMSKKPILRGPAATFLPSDDMQRIAMANALAHPVSLTEGNNGSGKSRVAENLIFHLLSTGKRVLYINGNQSGVREMYGRLVKHGLENAIVALGHDVPETAPAFPAAPMAPAASEISLPVLTAQIDHCKNEIDTYYQALKKVGLFGFSFTRSLQEFERCRDAEAVPFTPLELTGLDKDEIALRFDTAADLFAKGHACGEPHNHPLRFVTNDTLSDEEIGTIQKLFDTLPSLYDRFITQLSALCVSLEFPLCIDAAQTADLLDRVRTLITAPMPMVKTLLKSDLTENDSLLPALESAIKALEIRQEISERFDTAIFSLPITQLCLDWENAEELSHFKKRAARKKIIESIGALAIDGGSCKPDEIASLLIRLSLYRDRTDRAADAFPVVRNLFDFTADEWDDLPDDTVRQLYHAFTVCRMYKNRQSAADQRTLADTLPDSTEALSDLLLKAESAYGEWKNTVRELFILLQLQLSADQNDLSFAETMEMLLQTKSGLNTLPAWREWLCVKKRAIDLGLGKVVSMYETKPLTADAIEASFVKGFFEAACRSILLTEDVLRTFNPAAFSAQISHLEKLEERFREISLATFLSSHSELCSSYYLDHLRNAPQYARCLENNDRLHTGKLHTLLPEAALVRFPCVLACSSSILRKLRERADFAAFDFVIFDDAGTIPFDHALAISSFTQQIAVFASKHATDRALHPFLSDASPLCLTCREEIGSLYTALRHTCPVRTSLNEHYVAADRADIFASLLQKSPVSPSMASALPVSFEEAVSVEYVGDGYNEGFAPEEIEAAQVAKTVLALASQSHEKLSLGIVTGSDAQAGQVRRLLSRLISHESTLAEKLANEDSPLYISPLCNATVSVRDHIIFSPGISPTKQNGSLPLGATFIIPDCAARLEQMVSSVGKRLHLITAANPATLSDRLSLDHGYNALRHFFTAVAEKTVYRPLPPKAQPSPEAAVCETIVARLRAEGYLACYPFDSYVDIAVSAPDAPDTYLLGIVLDQTALRASDCTAARESVRPAALRKNGWQLHRVLSPAWYADRDACLSEIFAKLSR